LHCEAHNTSLKVIRNDFTISPTGRISHVIKCESLTLLAGCAFLWLH
jgi:hypothetical protein